MRIESFGRLQHPDFNDYVVHLTGRTGPTKSPLEVRETPPDRRLMEILASRRLLGFEMFGTGERAVCFTEATRKGVQWLLRDGRYPPLGVAFTKEVVFSKGGAPALYIRGDEWGEVASLPASLRARAVRLWPGAVPDEGEALAPYLTGRSEWLFEREWRAPLDDEGAWAFEQQDVAFLVVPGSDWFDRVGEIYAEHPEFVGWVRSLAFIAMGTDGEILEVRDVTLKEV